MGEMVSGLMSGSGSPMAGIAGGAGGGEDSGKSAALKALAGFSSFLSSLGGGTPVPGDNTKSAFNPSTAAGKQTSLIGKIRGIVNGGLEAQQESEDRLRNQMALADKVTDSGD